MLRFVAILSLFALAFGRKCGEVDESLIGPNVFTDEFIVGGVNARQNSLPFIVSWRYFNESTGVHRHICGGSILDDEWVVTAAHCVDINQDNTANPKLFKAGIGMWQQNKENDEQDTIDVAAITLHPGWNSQTLANDIAMVKLARPIGLANKKIVNKICVGRPEDETESRAVTISGWGLLKDKDPAGVPNYLQTADIVVEKQATCKSRYSIIIPILDSHVCAGYKVGVCNGDSGGPLHYRKDGRWCLLGATSFGAGGCGSSFFPGVFTRVPYYIDWIEKTTGLTLEQ